MDMVLFRGDLKSLNLAFYLNVINSSQTSGCFRLSHPHRPDTTLYFDEGRFIYAQNGTASNVMPSIVLNSERLYNQRESMIQESRLYTDKVFFQRLIDQYGLDQDSISRLARKHYAEILYNAAMRQEDRCELYHKKMPSDTSVLVRVDVTGLIENAQNMLKSTSAVTGNLTPMDRTRDFKLVRTSLTKVFPYQFIALTWFEWRVLDVIEQNRDNATIGEVAAILGMERRELLRIAYNLVTNGFLDIYNHEKTRRFNPGDKTTVLSQDRFGF